VGAATDERCRYGDERPDAVDHVTGAALFVDGGMTSYSGFATNG
jgi:hypothetical protein